MSELFANVDTPKLRAVKDAVCLNAAAALVAADAVTAPQLDVVAALKMRFADALAVIESGAAAAKLDSWISVSNK
jgi:anthranilate phosphoribosyltransferase